MRQLAELRERVTRVEKRVDEWQTVLNGHTKTLNAMRKDVVNQGERLAKLERKVHDGFAEMRKGFGDLAKGQELITKLLTKSLGEPEDETRAGGADE